MATRAETPRHIVMFSGGITSWAVARRLVNQFGTDSVLCLFADTRAEDEDLYRFNAEAIADLGCELVTVADGRNPQQVSWDKRWIGANRIAPCSYLLKQKPCRDWIDANARDADTLHVGIDWTETHRLPSIRRNWAPFRVEALLTEPPYVDKAQLIADLEARGIRPPRLYGLGFPHNNCGGACVRAGQGQWARLLSAFPERFASWEAHEDKMRARLDRDVAILRDRKGGAVRPLPLRVLRRRVEDRQAADVDMDDLGGCGCMSEESELQTGGPMATRAELTAEAQAVKDRNAKRDQLLIETAAGAGGLDVEQAQPIATALLEQLAGHWRAEALEIEAARRRGWKTLADQVTTCATHAAGIAESLKRYRFVASEDRPMPVEIVRDRRVSTIAALEEKLTAAFGPALAPVVHIRVPRDIDDPTPATRLCGAGDGTMSYAHEANCEICIALQVGGEIITANDHPDAGHGLPVYSNGVEPLPGETQVEYAAAVDAMREGELVGAVAASESATGVITVPVAFAEPRRLPQRMSFAEVVEHGTGRNRGADHRSVSQIEGFADCGVKYALSDLERPAWWSVGGTAFHAACEEINRFVVGGDPPLTAAVIGALWMRHFSTAVAAQLAARPDVPIAEWRAANKQAEGADWWRVEGEAMVSRYADWLRMMLAAGWSILTIDGTPVIEYETTLDVDGVKVVCVIDLALIRDGDGQMLIIDLKAGKSQPSDTFQLGMYGWALSVPLAGHRGPVGIGNLSGQYFMARKGETIEPVDGLRPLTDVHSWPSIVYRVHATDRAEKAAIYLPRPSSFCGGCGVSQLCPVGK